MLFLGTDVDLSLSLSPFLPSFLFLNPVLKPIVLFLTFHFPPSDVEFSKLVLFLQPLLHANSN